MTVAHRSRQAASPAMFSRGFPENCTVSICGLRCRAEQQVGYIRRSRCSPCTCQPIITSRMTPISSKIGREHTPLSETRVASPRSHRTDRISVVCVTARAHLGFVDWSLAMSLTAQRHFRTQRPSSPPSGQAGKWLSLLTRRSKLRATAPQIRPGAGSGGRAILDQSSVFGSSDLAEARERLTGIPKDADTS